MVKNTICIECLKDINLKRYVNKTGVEGQCSNCGNKKGLIVQIADKEFQNRFKAAIRYHYSEMLYNPHWGGYYNWIYLLTEENEILTEPLKESENEDDIFWEIEKIEGHVDDFAKDVSLYFGEARLDAFFDPIVRATWDWLFQLKGHISYINPQEIAKKIVEKCEDMIKDLERKEKNISLFRARLGVKDILHYAELGDEPEDVYIPYKKGEIGAPPAETASEGRFNRAGTSYLYLASTRDTAIKEIRPNVGHDVSIGEFFIKGEINIVDFTVLDFYDYATSDDKIDNYIKLRAIEKVISLPNPEKKYRLTQGFADAFYSLGYDGVKFNSSVSDGTYNLVLFKKEMAIYKKKSKEAFHISGMEYKVEEVKKDIDPKKADMYWTENRNEKKLLSEEFGIDIDELRGY